MRQMVLADHDFHVYAEVVGVAENFNDTANTLIAVGGELEDLHVDDHAVKIFDGFYFARIRADAINCRLMRRDLHAFGDFNPLLNTLIGGDDIVTAFLDAELTDDSDVGAAENANDFTFRPALASATGDVNERAVAMHAFGSFRMRKENVTFDASDGLVGDEKTETVAVKREAAGKIFGIVADGDEVAGAQFDEQAFFAEPVESVFEMVAVLAMQMQLADELLVGGAGVRKLANVLEQAGVSKG